jgi:hypothetical protein
MQLELGLATPGQGSASVATLVLESGEATLAMLIAPPVVDDNRNLWLAGRTGLLARVPLPSRGAVAGTATILGIPRDPAVERFVVSPGPNPALWALTDEGVLFWSAESARAGNGPDCRIDVATDRFNVGAVAPPHLLANAAAELFLRADDGMLHQITLAPGDSGSAPTCAPDVRRVEDSAGPTVVFGRGNLGWHRAVSPVLWDVAVTETDPVQLVFTRVDNPSPLSTVATIPVTPSDLDCAGSDCVLAVDVAPDGSRAVVLARASTSDPATLPLDDVVFLECLLGDRTTVSCTVLGQATPSTRPTRARLSVRDGPIVAAMDDTVIVVREGLQDTERIRTVNIPGVDGSAHAFVDGNCLVVPIGGSRPRVATVSLSGTVRGSGDVDGVLRDVVAVAPETLFLGGGFDGNDAPTAAQLLRMPRATSLDAFCADSTGLTTDQIRRLGPARPGTDLVGVAVQADRVFVGDRRGRVWSFPHGDDPQNPWIDQSAGLPADGGLSALIQRTIDGHAQVFAFSGSRVFAFSTTDDRFRVVATCPNLTPGSSVDVETAGTAPRLLLGGYDAIGVVQDDVCAVVPLAGAGTTVAVWDGFGAAVVYGSAAGAFFLLTALPDDDRTTVPLSGSRQTTGPLSLVQDGERLVLFGVDDGYAVRVDRTALPATVQITALPDAGASTAIALLP